MAQVLRCHRQSDRGISRFFTHHDFARGMEDFQHALELDPDDAFLVAAIGKGALLTGNFDLAISQYQAALAMEPVVPEFHWFLGRAYLISGRLEDAEASFRKLSSLSSSYRGDFHLWETLVMMGDLEAALVLSDSSFERAVVHYLLGNSEMAEEALADLIDDAPPYYWLAKVYGYRGDADKTFEWLDTIIATGEQYPIWILTDAAFRSVHSDERWPLILEELGLLEYWLEMAPAE